MIWNQTVYAKWLIIVGWLPCVIYFVLVDTIIFPLPRSSKKRLLHLALSLILPLILGLSNSLKSGFIATVYSSMGMEFLTVILAFYIFLSSQHNAGGKPLYKDMGWLSYLIISGLIFASIGPFYLELYDYLSRSNWMLMAYFALSCVYFGAYYFQIFKAIGNGKITPKPDSIPMQVFIITIFGWLGGLVVLNLVL